MTINELRDEVHKNAVAHGWWEDNRSFGEIIALCHSELSEALEEYRAGRPMVWRECKCTDPIAGCNRMVGIKQDGSPFNVLACTKLENDSGCTKFGDKPEGIAVELADCIIRILDYCGCAGIDIEEVIRIKHEYNKTRPYRHGGKVI